MYILIIVLLLGNTTTTVAEFKTKEACIAAANEFRAQQKHGTITTIMCTPKG